ncbi:MAG: hypothetical protein VB089_15575 [Anaerolineaceae bacterium]|jgi:hypothetical protein|nr:hypothetical protein [Anaerolineaceae bacterium]
MTSPLPIRNDYWETFRFQEEDLEFLYNHLLEIETPLTPQELIRALVTERIKNEKINLRSDLQAGGKVYYPKNRYAVGEKLVFPSNEWMQAVVTGVRPGYNPEFSEFDVIDVTFQDGKTQQYAAALAEHRLNTPIQVNEDDPNLDSVAVIKKYGMALAQSLTEQFEANPDLVRIAGRWFPRALLVDVNIGYLNLAEALLEMEEGGPLTTCQILEQIELPSDVNIKLTEFSFNLALQEDGRFDEVGPTGEILWYLKRLEPEEVKSIPLYLRYPTPAYPLAGFNDNTNGKLPGQIVDELEHAEDDPSTSVDKITFSLLYPHWRSGTLPLTAQTKHIFPNAMEAPRIRFTFVDGHSGQKFPGWVVLANAYVFGLQDWFNEKGLIPGSLVTLQRGSQPGEVRISVDEKRASRDWVRTALVGNDGMIVLAVLKQMISTSYDERMAIFVPDTHALDQLWEQNARQRKPLESVVIHMMRELAKLSPQGQVHAQELYSTINLVRRCPSEPILSILNSSKWASYLGDFYYRLDEAILEKTIHE